MAENRQFDSSILTDKESIRQNIRNALSNKMEVVNAEMDINMNADVYEKIDHPVAVFLEKFRENGTGHVEANKPIIYPLSKHHQRQRRKGRC